MTFLQGRDGNISVIRVGLMMMAIAVLLVIGSVIAVSLDQSARRVPLEIRLPAGAEPWGERTYAPTWRQLFYRVPGADADAVAAHYIEEVRSYAGNDPNDPNKCNRFPQFGEFVNFDARGEPPYYWLCMFDRSGVNASQWTQVTIHPGVPDPDPQMDTSGDVVIIYEQLWQP